jgi:hypothetical protein
MASGGFSPRSGSKPSPVHDFFVPDPVRLGKFLCRAEVGCTVSVSGEGTSARRRHLQRIHKLVWKGIEAEDKHEEESDASSSENDEVAAAASRGPAQTTLDGFVQTPRVVSKLAKAAVDRAVLNFVIEDMQPFSVVDEPSFHQIFQALGVDYKPPCRQTVRTRLTPHHQRLVSKVADAIQAEALSVSITHDCWTSSNNVGFIAATAHWLTDKFEPRRACVAVCALEGSHTGENLKSALEKSLIMSKAVPVEAQTLGKQTVASLVGLLFVTDENCTSR